MITSGRTPSEVNIWRLKEATSELDHLCSVALLASHCKSAGEIAHFCDVLRLIHRDLLRIVYDDLHEVVEYFEKEAAEG